MFKMKNSNPSGAKLGDCVIRAISTALGKSWEEVYIELCLQGYLMSDLPSSNAVWNAYLINKGWRRELVRNDFRECFTINKFTEEFPNGTYILGTGTHATAVIDGDIYDTWDCGNEHPIYYYFKEDEI